MTAVALLALSPSGADAFISGDMRNPSAFGKEDIVDFSHFCASEHPHLRSAWTLFSGDEGALALIRVDTGWVGGVDPNGIDVPGISVWPELIQLPGEHGNVSLQFSVGNASSGESPVLLRNDNPGDNSLYWDGHDWMANSDVENSLSIRGEDFPTDEDPVLSLSASIPGRTAPLVLQGPTISQADLEIARELPEPEFQILGFLDVLNPFQKGGLVDTMRMQLKYDSCKSARRKLRQTFANPNFTP